jgi:hypothetical protein
MASKDLTSALASINFELVTNTYLAGTQQPSLADCAAVWRKETERIGIVQ